MTSRSDKSSIPYADVRETHTGAVILLGEHAYKLKKPVRLGFVDFSTVEQRRHACARELELNRRFSPDVYLGLAELRSPDGSAEPLVTMRRMPDDRRLSLLVRRGPADHDLVRQVARRVAVVHASADRSALTAAEGTRDATRARWTANLEQAAAQRPAVLPAPTIQEVARLVDRFLTGRGPLFDARVAAGLVVDGHGDLLADDIFCLPDGPRILDCLEFDDRLRYVDVLDDVAFLAMDLESLGGRDWADAFLASYLELSGDPAPVALLEHFMGYRAFVRAKVLALRAAQQPGGGFAPLAVRHADLAADHLRAAAVTAVVVGGPPGTGKTTLAGDLADRLGMVVVSSDRVRKELAGLDPLASGAAAYLAGIYTPEWTERTYAEMLRRASRLLALGESVVLDATWAEGRWRELAREVARDASSDLVELRCDLPGPVAATRIRLRAAAPTGESDADECIAAAVRSAQDPWPESTGVATSRPRETCLERALAVVRPRPVQRRRANPRLTPD